MAEAIIVSIAGEIIASLAPQALEKIGKLWGIKHDVEMLRDIVSEVQAAVDAAKKQYHESHEIEDWHNQMKYALYDAQDVIEEFNIKAMRRELKGHNKMMKVRTFFSNSNSLAFKLKTNHKVRAVRERIEAINADRGIHLNERPVDLQVEREQRERVTALKKRIEAIKAGRGIHLNERPVDLQVEREQRERGETHSFIREEDITGRDSDKKIIMEFLLDSNMNENVSILPIVGTCGLGKTALAQFVFNDKAVSKQFNLKMWVYVSNDFDMKKIVKKMLASAQQKEPTEDTMELLQSTLRAEINEKRYLLVLDNLQITELEIWLSLKTLLLGGAKGSKILITTRLPLVANITGTTSTHFLKSLCDSESFDLLVQIACCNKEELQDPDMLAIVKDMVRECHGVPLSIRTVGGLLFKKTRSEWLQFKDYELPKVFQREDHIKSILKLSYDRLPSHLKQCFAFCSLFPKDYELKKQTLVDLWMAEGFIQPSEGKHLEDIAHEYFKDLLRLNFFQEFQEDVGTCKMHDFRHDLACTVVGTEYWVAWDGAKSIHENTRHISYDFTSNLIGELPISCLKASALRTFLSPVGYEIERTSEVDLRRLIQSFKRLRILDLHAANVKKVPRSIYKFKHLTYLDFSYNNALKRLPNSITRLQNLQTLNLHHCRSLKELPRDIKKLVSLQNLYIDDCDKLSYMPRGLGQLSSLHRLTCFILPRDKAGAKKYCGLRELNGLNKIRGTLYIKNLGSVTNTVEEFQAANLKEKCSLEVLVLSWGIFNITNEAVITTRDEALLDGLRLPHNLRKLIINGYNGESFPRWMTELPNLVELELMGCKRCKHFPQFSLSNLKRLYISGMNSLEYLPRECLESLSSLESLTIIDFPRLTSLPLGLRHLSKLNYLNIGNCEELDLSKDESGNMDFHGLQNLWNLQISDLPKLESLPQWILQLRNLLWLRIEDCPNFKELSEQIEKCEEPDISKDESGNILDFHEILPSLRLMEFIQLPKLTSLPQWLLQSYELQHLVIRKCDSLKDIPEQIEALHFS